MEKEIISSASLPSISSVQLPTDLVSSVGLCIPCAPNSNIKRMHWLSLLRLCGQIWCLLAYKYIKPWEDILKDPQVSRTCFKDYQLSSVCSHLGLPFTFYSQSLANLCLFSIHRGFHFFLGLLLLTSEPLIDTIILDSKLPFQTQYILDMLID